MIVPPATWCSNVYKSASAVVVERRRADDGETVADGDGLRRASIHPRIPVWGLHELVRLQRQHKRCCRSKIHPIIVLLNSEVVPVDKISRGVEEVQVPAHETRTEVRPTHVSHDNLIE